MLLCIHAFKVYYTWISLKNDGNLLNVEINNLQKHLSKLNVCDKTHFAVKKKKNTKNNLLKKKDEITKHMYI